jgi:glutathione-independent formaldehyde dehydrogenase
VPFADFNCPGRAELRVSHQLPLNQAPEAYEKLDKRIEGYTTVIL